jgi:hypothetical protein
MVNWQSLAVRVSGIAVLFDYLVVPGKTIVQSGESHQFSA